MDNAYLEIDNIEIEVLIDNGGGIEGFMINGEPVDMRNDDSAAEFILEHMEELQEEAACVIREWRSRHVANRAVFNYTNPEHEDFKKCWALSNLQPMWAKDNMSKGMKLKKHFQPSLLLGEG